MGNSNSSSDVTTLPQINFKHQEIDTPEPQNYVKIVQKYWTTPRPKLPRNMLENKKYQVLLHKSLPFGGRHAIVISDPDEMNKDITFEFSGSTIGGIVGLVPGVTRYFLGEFTGYLRGKASNLESSSLGGFILGASHLGMCYLKGSIPTYIASYVPAMANLISPVTSNPLLQHAANIGMGKFIDDAIASLTRGKLTSDVFSGDKSQCIDMGTVESTHYELTEIAVKVHNSIPHYDLFFNNSQQFCKKYLQATVSQTYKTDLDRVKMVLWNTAVCTYNITNAIIVGSGQAELKFKRPYWYL